MVAGSRVTRTGNSPPDPAFLFDMAVREYRRANPDAAKSLLDAHLEIDPGHSDAWLLLSETHLQSGRETAALACLRRALSLVPDDVGVLEHLSKRLLDVGRFGEAAEIARQAAELDPANEALAYLHGVALARDRRTEKALDAFSGILSSNPEHASAAFETAMLLLARGDFAAGWPHYEMRHGPSGSAGAKGRRAVERRTGARQTPAGDAGRRFRRHGLGSAFPACGEGPRI